MRLVTITLGPRKWETTCIAEAICFVHSFGSSDGFTFKSVPYEGKSIDWIISLN